jgi:oxygen-independent coproporphyrinogen-3 oxidase
MYIYIHIPFCNNICSYCDFPKLLYNEKYINKYLEVLEQEIKKRYKNEIVTSIYIGGGTPTSLSLNELEKLLNITNLFNKGSNLEFTIESNIESLDVDKINLLASYNINRISLGVQSFQNNILQILNRKHTKEQVLEIINTLKQHNLTNISIDLIYGVTSNFEDLRQDLDTFLKLDIPHLSYYGLIIEDNTIFSINKRQYIDDDLEYKMYKYIETVLKNNDYQHYETSNYAKVGYQSRHNLNYWNNGEYYGFGLGAVSYLNNYRMTNTKNLTKYFANNYLDNKQYEDEELRISNTIILGLRKTKGINLEEFQLKYHCNLIDLYNIKDLLREKKLILQDNKLFINPKYYYLSNEILINFL